MALIAGRQLQWLPIGRPAGAMLGAVLTVAFGVLSPDQALHAADPRTLALLLGMMLLGGYLDHDGVMPWLEGRLLARARSPWAALVGLTLSSALLSALVMNDTVCVLLTPLVVRFCLARGLPLPPFLLALATAANLGSAATLVGNPQNVLVGAMSGVSYARYLSLAGPAVVLALLAHLGLLALLFRRRLPTTLAATSAPAPARPRAITLAVLVGVCVAFLLGADLAWTGLSAAALLVISHREDPAHIFAKVDWTLLVFFAALFVVMGGVEGQGLLAGPLQALVAHVSLTDLPGAAAFTLLVVAGSNLLSNVPFVLLFGRELGGAGTGDLGWVLLGFVSTVAGNLTLVGSMANLIVAEAARPHHDLGFWEYARLGIASTILTLAVGVPVIAALHSWVPA